MDYTNPSIADTLLISLIGFLTVFAVLIILMTIIKLISLASGKSEKSEVKEAPSDAKANAAVQYEGVKLYDTPEKTAAAIMAIVADNLDTPLENLRFISIREVK